MAVVLGLLSLAVENSPFGFGQFDVRAREFAKDNNAMGQRSRQNDSPGTKAGIMHA